MLILSDNNISMMLGSKILLMISLTSLGQSFSMFVPGSKSPDIDQVLLVFTV